MRPARVGLGITELVTQRDGKEGRNPASLRGGQRVGGLVGWFFSFLFKQRFCLISNFFF